MRGDPAIDSRGVTCFKRISFELQRRSDQAVCNVPGTVHKREKLEPLVRIEFCVDLRKQAFERMAQIAIQSVGFALLARFRGEQREREGMRPAIAHDAGGFERGMNAESSFNRYRGDVFALAGLELFLNAADDFQLTVRRQLTL